MLIGIDWGGTKIEGVAMTPEGKELVRLREDTPRHDYHGCIRVIVDLIARMEQQTGQRGSIGIGIPGSLEPRSRLSPLPAWTVRARSTCIALSITTGLR